MEKTINGKLGFGCMRLPLIDGKPDEVQFGRMVDLFMQSGFNYFDTSRVYVNGQSEVLLRKYLVDRYPRDSFVLTDKLTTTTFKHAGGVKDVFESQLKTCNVDYFDYYLMHSQSRDLFAKYKRCNAYEQAIDFLEKGKIKHFGISFHDTAEVLEQILTEYPQIEIVQIQLNYADMDDTAIQSRKCYETCVKFNKKVIVMEPVKGGVLARNLMPEVQKEIEKTGISPAELAIRYAAGFDNVIVVLSGMSSVEQMNENINFMKEFKPLTNEQLKATEKIASILHSRKDLISCTSCHYCTPGCPRNILIPELFACYNTALVFPDKKSSWYYNFVYTVNNGKASSCIGCGQCKALCPQHLDIPNLLKDVAKMYEVPEKVI